MCAFWRWGVCMVIFLLYLYTKPVTLYFGLGVFLTGRSMLLFLEVA